MIDLELHNLNSLYANKLDTQKFAQMLDDPSQCYKFYWLEAIMNLLPEHENEICFDDIVNEIAEKLKAADGMVIGSPVYYGSANSTLTALLDRLFFSFDFYCVVVESCSIWRLNDFARSSINDKSFAVMNFFCNSFYKIQNNKY